MERIMSICELSMTHILSNFSTIWPTLGCRYTRSKAIIISWWAVLPIPLLCYHLNGWLDVGILETQFCQPATMYMKPLRNILIKNASRLQTSDNSFNNKITMIIIEAPGNYVMVNCFQVISMQQIRSDLWLQIEYTSSDSLTASTEL